MRLISLLKLTLTLIFGVTCLIIIAYFAIFEQKELIYEGIPKILPSDKETARLAMDGRIKEHSSSQECVQPNLAVDAPEIMRFIHHTSPINCSSAENDWVICENTECRIRHETKARIKGVRCSFTDIYRFNEDIIKKRGYSDTGITYNLEKSDLVHVSCRSSKQRWSSILTGIRLDYEVWKRANWKYVPYDAMKLNVLVFGLNSISRNAFIRKLPKTYKYLIRDLNGLVLEGYNILGDSINQAVTPILTGKTELELPDTRKRFEDSDFVDVYPFVWNEFRSSGYVTAFFDDMFQGGIYNSRLRGFKNVPTDHYMRPFYLSIAKELNKSPKFCVGSIPRHKVMMNHIVDFFTVYEPKPKFLFGFQGELSFDDYNLVGAIDDDFVEFLKTLERIGALENTILIIMSDHGHGFGKIRETIQGKQEERLPFVSFRFPPWFKSYYKEMYDNFVVNTKRLTTPFDIHDTLNNILHLSYRSTSKRSFSLFDEIPEERSCSDAYIEPHWCSCMEWNAVDPRMPIVERLTNTFITTVNTYTSSYRKLCAELKISKIIWILKLNPNENLVKFRQHADIDNFHPDMSSKMLVEKENYQIRVLVKPGKALFEASIEHYLADNNFTLRMEYISRINKYGNDANCVHNFPHLRKYCYCTVLNKTF